MSDVTSQDAGQAIHFTMFNFNESLNLEDRERVLNVTRALGSLPTIQHLVIGAAMPAHQEVTERFNYISIVGFANGEDHDVYMVCDERKAMGQVFMPTQVGWIAADLHSPGLESLWRTNANRLRHVMFFGFKDEVAEADRMRSLDALRGLEAMSGVGALVLARNLQPWSPNSPAEWMMIADFDNQESFSNFQTSPNYIAAVERQIRPQTSNIYLGEIMIKPSIMGR